MIRNIVGMVVIVDKKTIKRLLTYCQPYRLILLGILVLSFFSVCLSLITPVLLGWAIDLLIGINQVDFDALLKQLMIIVIVIVAGALVQGF